MILENVASISRGKYIPVKWYDIINHRESNDEERTGDEIAADVIKRIGLTFGGDEANGFDDATGETSA